MSINEQLFLDRYNNLNQRQKQAVDTIYGPVMVIAGPGTGKTEVLSMRIANLLRSEAQVQPSEILCLTYTEEATNSMRRRLVQIIGTAAHKVNICTFHAFCNNIIQQNSEYFSIRSLQPITDLERTELLYEMLEELPSGHVLRRLSGNIYFDVNKLSRLFDMMKREHLTASSIADAVEEYINDLPNRKEYIYQRKGKGFEKGDLKQAAIDDEVRKVNDTKAAAALFDVYQQKMKEAGRYDFNDMIIWVLEEFKENPALLLSYQERHQFILVDEFQDTNGAQNELLNSLTEFWDDPNIFVVGDDDQSIYEFQGARIRNIIDFYQRFKENINVVVLPENYRSSQAILDIATATIDNNNERLIKQLEELQLDKNIVSSSTRFADGKETIQPVVTEYPNILQEEAAVVQHIEQLQKAKIPLGDIAVLYAQHKQANNIIAILERKGIPYSVKKPVNILDLPLVQQVLNILKYLNEEQKQAFSAETLLFELMHSPYFGINATDIAMISLYMQANKSKDSSLRYWRLVLGNKLMLATQLDLKSVQALHRFGDCVERWMAEQSSLPLPLLIEKIVYESGIVKYLIGTKDYTWNIQVLNTFFEHVKDAYGRDAKITSDAYLQMIDKMRSENIALPIQKVVQNEHGVQFYTTHGAKGNEFEHVFLIGATKNFWESKRGLSNEYKLPDTITNTKDDKDKTYKTEVARRLFYVALTRAKKHLYISYAAADNDGKPIEHSVFIDEISKEEDRQQQQLAEKDLVEHMQLAMEPVSEVRIELANNMWIDKVLQSFIMSYTTLSKYLNCPVSFYYQYILKVPFQKNDAMAFGSAVHDALERMFRIMKEQNGTFPSKEEVLKIFDNAMYRESSAFTPIQYERRMEQGHTLLNDYYDEYINSFHKDVEIELSIPRYILNGVPITGKIDKMEMNGDNCTVVDYKTGDPDRSAKAYTAAPNEANPNGGDYWRQMVFYKLIIENHPDRNWKVDMGMFDYVEKGSKTNQYKRIKVPVFAQDEEIVLKQMKDSYTSIMNHDFDKGCGKEDCYWCNFTRKYELNRPADITPTQED
ncbi:MAG: ATP-dependent DNA helicase [Flavipsychrobacter sp.]